MISPKQPCPCTSGLAYGKCCRPAHRGADIGPEALMRSRYAAYALGKARYIMQTTTEQRVDVPRWKAEIERFCEQTEFTGLTILEVLEGQRESYVTFRAGLRQGGRDASFTERSRFERGQRWTYSDGERLRADG